MLLATIFSSFLFSFIAVSSSDVDSQERLLALSIGTEETDGLTRFRRSASVWGLDVEVLGGGQEWRGGDVLKGPGGGQKVRLLKESLLTMKPRPSPQTVVLFTDSYDVIFLAGKEELLKRFKATKAKVLFGAEDFCWPDPSLAGQYPHAWQGSRFLNSGAFMGYYPEVVSILTHAPIRDDDDDQLYYTKVFLNSTARDHFGIKLDHLSKIFQNLNGAESQVELAGDEQGWLTLANTKHKTRPIVVHGNGPSKVVLNKFGNFLAKSWSSDKGCAFCKEKRITLKEDSVPFCLLAIFVEQPTPFFAEFLESIDKLDYPKSHLHVFVHSSVEFHEVDLEQFVETAKQQYKSVKVIHSEDRVSESDARQLALVRGAKLKAAVLSVDSVARLRPLALRALLASGLPVVAPLLVRPERAWSNFWGALSPDGFYQRDDLYMEIIQGKLRGVWNVPFINSCYLLSVSIIGQLSTLSMFSRGGVDPDMAFCANLRDKGRFMFVSNEEELGHLVEPDSFNTSLTHPDFYQLLENRLEWEERYLHPLYHETFLPQKKTEEPCPDVYRFPFASERFCKELIEVVETFGKWSDGSNSDSRLPTGYEAVPTRDIHMFQVGLEKVWRIILKDYVWPLQELVFIGYVPSDPSRTFMNFVVRYRPDEQPELRPHHDSSTFTLNLALNTPDVDYSGGGCRFIRYNCTVKDSRPGWMLMHPGRLTHYHEGLRVTNGTRYIMITFADP